MEAIDCGSPLTPATAAALKRAGIIAAGRYLGALTMPSWKTLYPAEAHAIHDAGLALFLIWESNPTSAGYFSYSRGLQDARMAAREAKNLEASDGTALFFTVDYDAQPNHMPAIIEYFRGVRDGLAGEFKVGAYGSYSVMEALENSANPPDRYFQTYAWSGGRIFDAAHIYQYQNDTSLGGVAVDRDHIQNQAGTWPELGGDYVPKHAIIYFTDRDFSSARIVSDLLGGCGMFCRNGNNAFIHQDAKEAEHLVIIGGAEYSDHPNVTNCCGIGAPETAIKAAEYAQKLASS